MIKLDNQNRMLGYKLLSSYSNISHFVTTRHGGESEGKYASYNCSPYSGDNGENVEKNQKILREFLIDEEMELVIPYQTHGTTIVTIDSGFNSLTSEEKDLALHGVDALITKEKKMCLCVSTADCVPIILYDPYQEVIGVVHAGWRGTVNRILEKTIRKMGETYGSNPETIKACIGPSICVDSFEVGDEVWREFEEKGFDMSLLSYRHSLTNNWHIDLWKANEVQLKSSGVLPSSIELAGICTYIHDHTFFSARRLGINSGRILSGIVLH